MIVDYELKSQVKLRNAEQRNIIFLGKTRNGKTTVFKTMQKLTTMTGHGSLFSDTVDPKLHSFTVAIGSKENETNFNINIIDTPGLFEVKLDPNAQRTNDLLQRTIYTCLEYEITKINIIFIVVSLQAGLSGEDVESINIFMELFKGGEDMVYLLVTHAETFTSEKNKK